MGIAEIIALAMMLLKFATLMFGEYFAHKERARQAEKEFKLDEATRREIFDKATIKFKDSLAQDSGSMQDFEDTMDQRRKDKNLKEKIQ